MEKKFPTLKNGILCVYNGFTRTVLKPLSALVGVNDRQTLTNKTIDASKNTLIGVTPEDIVNSQISSTAAIDATKICDGSISCTEFQYLNGLTGNIQDQLDAILALISNNCIVNGPSGANYILNGASGANYIETKVC